MAGATSSAHTWQVQVWIEPNIPFHPGSHHSLLLATVPGEANAFNGTARRSLYNRLPFHGRLCRLVPGEGHPGMGIQDGHLQCDSVSCTHRRASHHGLAGKASEISHSFRHVCVLSELGWSCVNCRCWRCMLAQASSQ